MSEDPIGAAFDVDMAWMRRFESDAAGNLNALALRLREALPNQVTVHSASRGLLRRTSTVTGVSVHLGESVYTLALEHGRLKATIALIVRDVAISNKTVSADDWFRRLAAETKSSSEQAKNLSRSINDFMTK